MIAATATHAANYKLNLFIWSEYIDPALITEFEKRFDAKVVIDLFEEGGFFALFFFGKVLTDSYTLYLKTVHEGI